MKSFHSKRQYLVHFVAIDFPGGKRRHNIKMKAQLRIFIWRTITVEKQKIFKTTLLTLELKQLY